MDRILPSPANIRRPDLPKCFLFPGISMGQKTRRFFNDEKVLIFICDPKLAFYTSVSLLSRQIVQFLLRYVQRQLVAFLQDRILMRTFPIDLYIFSYGL